MGYESKIYIVERVEWKNVFGEKIVTGMIVATFDLCNVGYNNRKFFNAFRNEIDYGLYLPGIDDYGNEALICQRKDCYGDWMKSADISEVIDALKEAEQREHYRRFPPVIAMLEAFRDELADWNSGGCTLQVVHYGY